MPWEELVASPDVAHSRLPGRLGLPPRPSIGENHMKTHSQPQPASGGSRLRRLSAGLALAAAAAVAAPSGAGAAPAVPGAEPVVIVANDASTANSRLRSRSWTASRCAKTTAM